MNEWWKNFVEEIGDVIKDLAVTAAWLFAIWSLGKLDHYLVPPDGLTIYSGTARAFKLEWILQTGEVLGVILFVVRSLVRVATRKWKS